MRKLSVDIICESCQLTYHTHDQISKLKDCWNGITKLSVDKISVDILSVRFQFKNIMELSFDIVLVSRGRGIIWVSATQLIIKMMNVCGQDGPGTRRTPFVSPTSTSPTSSTCTAKRTTSTSACHTSLLIGQLCHFYLHNNLGTVCFAL